MLERALGRLDRITRRRRSEPDMPAHLATGLAGEDAAFFDLRRKGYTIVARRWSSGDVPGDVDLICVARVPAVLRRSENAHGV